MSTIYDFLVDTYDTERLKTLSVWSMFGDDDLAIRPHETDERGRNALEQMTHQCMSENLWFVKMLDIDVEAPPLPRQETRICFIERYAEDSGKRLGILREKPESWWAGQTGFFEVERSRAWVMTRRIAHSAHHRGQQTAMLRMLGRDLHSTYGPTADSGGLPADDAPTLYAYDSLDALIEGETAGGAKTPLPGAGDHAVTERPNSKEA